MLKITLGIDGMKCGMCESHINETIRKVAHVRKVASSHGKGQSVVICEDAVDEEQLKQAVEAQGYRVLSVSRETYEKKGLFSFLKK